MTARIDHTRPFVPVRIAVLTISDTRTPKTDKSGPLLAQMIEEAGHTLAGRAVAPDDEKSIRSNSERFRIVKFYRPGRWSREQIKEEHQFLLDLAELDIPVVAPVVFGDGESILEVPDCNIFCAVFPKIGGRNPDELSDSQLPLIGRLLARLHSAGAIRPAEHRIQLHTETYGYQSLDFLLNSQSLPEHLEQPYIDLVEEICEIIEPWFEEAEVQRIHGDCHLGNLLWGDLGPFWVDFDDMLRGPCVQDIWLIIPGRDDFAKRQLDILLEAYDQMRSFDFRSLRLIEGLRALRMIHFDAWIAKRWDDPAFPKSFPEFGTEKYWAEQLQRLEEQCELL